MSNMNLLTHTYIPIAGEADEHEHPLGKLELKRQREEINKENASKHVEWVDCHRLEQRIYFTDVGRERIAILLSEAKRLDKKGSDIERWESKWERLESIVNDALDKHVPVDKVSEFLTTMCLFQNGQQWEGAFMGPTAFFHKSRRRDEQRRRVILRLGK